MMEDHRARDQPQRSIWFGQRIDLLSDAEHEIARGGMPQVPEPRFSSPECGFENLELATARKKSGHAETMILAVNRQ